MMRFTITGSDDDHREFIWELYDSEDDRYIVNDAKLEELKELCGDEHIPELLDILGYPKNFMVLESYQINSIEIDKRAEFEIRKKAITEWFERVKGKFNKRKESYHEF